MFPPIFQLVSDSTAVKALIGTSPVRFYLFGEATQLTPKPYSVWQMVYGSPENYLGEIPDIDNLGCQIDSYATTASGARAVTTAIRDALEPYSYVVNWRGEEKDVPTGLYRSSFDVEFWVDRIPNVPVVTTLGLAGDEAGNTLILSGEAQSSGSDTLVI